MKLKPFIDTWIDTDRLGIQIELRRMPITVKPGVSKYEYWICIHLIVFGIAAGFQYDDSGVVWDEYIGSL